MTRINVVPPSELSNKHLVAEYRELPRVFNLARPGRDIPRTYRLGAGHVKFFYDKLAFIHRRYLELCAEMRNRNITVNYPEPYKNPYLELYGDYTPTAEALKINRQRIKERSSAGN